MDKKHPIDTDWFLAQMAAAGLDQEDVARSLDVDRSNVSKTLRGKISFNARKAGIWAQLLRVKESDVLERVGIMTGTPPQGQDSALKKPHNPDDNIEREDSNVRYAPAKMLDNSWLNRSRVPLMGTGMGGDDGSFELNTGEPIDWKPRPPKAEGAKIYCIYVEGSSMEPRIDAGDLLFIDPSRKVIVGRDALIELKPTKEGDQPRALVKHIMAINSEFIEVKQFNPEKKWKIQRVRIRNLHLVLKNSEMY